MSPAPKGWFTGPQSDPYRYRVVDPEGIAGGEALVLQAERRDGREVALKQIAEANPRQRDRLLEQALALEELHHPNVVEQVDAFVGPGLFQGPPPAAEDFDLLYLVSGWVKGATLAALGTVDSATKALDLLSDIAAGVDHLHANGILHRDLHPGNVVLAADRAVVIDLAYVRAAAAPAISVVFGAPGFVPPERLDDPGSATESADRWQVAMLAVQLLLGRPRRRESLAHVREELARALSGAVVDPASGAHQIVQMLASDPELRPAIPLVRWVSDIRTGSTTELRPTNSEAPPPTGRRLHRPSRAQAVVLGAVAVISVAMVLLSWNPRPAAPPVTARSPASVPAPGCLIAVGESDRRIPLPPARYSEIAQLGRDVHACPTAIVDAWGPMAVQTFDSTSFVGALVSSGPGRSFALTQAQWAGYRAIGGADGSRAAELAGPIISVTTSPSSDVLHTTMGNLIGDSPTAPHVFVPQPARSASP